MILLLLLLDSLSCMYIYCHILISFPIHPIGSPEERMMEVGLVLLAATDLGCCPLLLCSAVHCTVYGGGVGRLLLLFMERQLSPASSLFPFFHKLALRI